MKYLISLFVFICLIPLIILADSGQTGSQKFNLINNTYSGKKLNKDTFNLLNNIICKIPAPNPPVAPRIWRKNDHNPVSNIVWREVHPRDGLTWWEDKTLGVVWRYLRPDEDPVTLKVPGQTESGVSQLAQPFRGQSNCPT